MEDTGNLRKPIKGKKIIGNISEKGDLSKLKTLSGTQEKHKGSQPNLQNVKIQRKFKPSDSESNLSLGDEKEIFYF